MEQIEFHLKPVKTPLLKAGITYNENAPTAGSSKDSFGKTIAKAVKNLKEVHNEAAVKMQDYAAGKDLDVTEVMLTMEKASVATQLAIQIRNRLVEGYHELTRMQI